MYEQGSFEPVARVVQLSKALEKQRIAEKILYVEQHVPYGIINQDFYDRIEQAKTPLLKIYHYHCNHLGTPQELTNQDGDVIWLSYNRAWGGSFETIYKQQFIDNWAISESELQPFKFQGQSLDVETGLHYNRFRYYDSDVGMFISRDPIGLLGGSNVFQYAPNPVRWIDPWGLAKLHKNNKNYEGNFSLYSVWEDDSRTEILKIGKADADDIMPTTGDVRRMHTSLRKAQVNYPKAVAGITLELGKTTTGNAEAIEASQVRALREQGHKLPLNKERRKAYHPEKPPTKGKNSCTK